MKTTAKEAGMEVQWLGHAGIKVSSGGSTLYIDPSEMDYVGPEGRRLIAGLEPGDAILFTHGHDDHCATGTFKKLMKQSTVLAGPVGCSDKAGSALKVVAPGEEISVGPFAIKAVHAYNIKRERSPGTPFHPRGTGVGYIITADGKSVYHVGDTEPIPEMRDVGPVDVALIPVDGHFTMSADEAAQVALVVRAGVFIPMHYFNTTVEEAVAAAGHLEGVNMRTVALGRSYTVE